MKKNIESFLLVSLVLFVSCLSFFMMRKQPKDLVKIALMSLADSPLVERMRNGFIENVHKELNAEITIYSADGSRNLARSYVEDILTSNFDLVCTLGTACTQLAKELSAKKQRNIPVIFGAIKDPVGLNIIASEKNSGNNLTGVAIDFDYAREALKKSELLRTHLPKAQKALIVYHGTSTFFEHDVTLLEKALLTKNFQVQRLPIFASNEVIQKVSTFAPTTDVILTLRDNVVLAALESLIKICRTNNITLFTSELESVSKGADMGYGQDEYETGAACAQKALEVLVAQKKPCDIPMTCSYNPRLKINA